MDPTVDRLLNEDVLIPLVAMIGGTCIAITAIIFTALRAMSHRRTTEQTKREVAAYVAEGTLDPDKAVAIINAGRSHSVEGKAGKTGGCC